MPVSEETFRRVALEDPEGHWELHDGRLREKPGMSYPHNFAMTYLGHQLISQLDVDDYEVRINAGHVNKTERSLYIPDVFVLPTCQLGPDRHRMVLLEVYHEPLPLVVEVGSPSTGGYDKNAKIPEYMNRGDLEIWRLHPEERTLTAWRRRPDSGYDEVVDRGGIVQPVALPDVIVDLDALFR